MQAPVVSIIVPVWNVEPYLPTCLGSLAAQTLYNVEVVVVDDGSTDATLAICQDFAERDSRFKVFSKKNEGQGVARNFGFDRACGVYVCYVDGDDRVDRRLCESSVQLIEQTGADFVNFGIEFVLPSGRVKRQMNDYRHAEIPAPELFELALLDDQIFSTPCNKLYRREMLSRHNIRFPAVLAHEDVLFSRALAYVSQRTAFSPTILYHALVRPGSTSRLMTSGHLREAIEVLALEREFFATHAGPAVKDELFSAHVVKLLSYLLVQAAFRVSSDSEYRRCFEIADEASFFRLADRRDVLRHLPVRTRFLASRCLHPRSLRILAHASRLAGVTPY
jgi:glycosyltransferase involved in cell wall biosynthesis